MSARSCRSAVVEHESTRRSAFATVDFGNESGSRTGCGILWAARISRQSGRIVPSSRTSLRYRAPVSMVTPQMSLSVTRRE